MILQNGKSVISVAVVLIAASLGFNTSEGEPAWRCENARLGVLKQASVLLDRTVADDREKSLGQMQDLLLDLPSGEVILTLVASDRSGLATAVPPRCYTRVSTGKLLVSADKQTFRTGKRFSRTVPGAAMEANTLDEICQHFGQGALERSSGDVAVRLSSTLDLLGAAVVSRSHEPIGHLKDIMIDLQLGRVIYLVIEPHPGLAPPGFLFSIPPRAVAEGAFSGDIALKTDCAHFLAGPHFDREYWTDMAFPELADAVRRHYGAQLVLAPSEGSNPAAKHEKNVLEPAAATDSFRPAQHDKEITQAVLEEIVHSANGFLNINVGIKTLKGKVKLSGTVKSDKQHKQVLAAAQKVVGVENVEDGLELQTRGSTARL